MTTPTTTSRMPAPIVAALVLLLAVAAIGGYRATRGEFEMISYLSTAAAVGALYAVLGSWRGWITGQSVAVMVGALVAFGGFLLATSTNLALRLSDYDSVGYLLLVIGAGLVGLVLVPQSSRDWYRR